MFPEALHELYDAARARGMEPIAFREPDLNDALTALAFIPHADNKRMLANLPLAGRKAGKLNKHTGGSNG